MKKKQIEDTLVGVKLTDVEYRKSNKDGKIRGGQVHSGGTRKARVTVGGQFEDPIYSVARAFSEAMERARSFKPVKMIDPKTVESPNLSVDQWGAKRALAAKLARKYYNFGEMQKYARWLRQGKPLTMYQCAVILSYAKNIKNWIEKNGDKPKEE